MRVFMSFPSFNVSNFNLTFYTKILKHATLKIGPSKDHQGLDVTQRLPSMFDKLEHAAHQDLLEPFVSSATLATGLATILASSAPTNPAQSPQLSWVRCFSEWRWWARQLST